MFLSEQNNPRLDKKRMEERFRQQGFHLDSEDMPAYFQDPADVPAQEFLEDIPAASMPYEAIVAEKAELKTAVLASPDSPAPSGDSFVWSQDRVDVLMCLWKAGRSAADIAKVIGGGITRNAVIGKANRLRLSGQKFLKSGSDKDDAA